MHNNYIGEYSLHTMVSAGPLNDIMSSKTEVTFDIRNISTRLYNMVVNNLNSGEPVRGWGKCTKLIKLLQASYEYSTVPQDDAHTANLYLPDEHVQVIRTAAQVCGSGLVDSNVPGLYYFGSWTGSDVKYVTTIGPMIRSLGIEDLWRQRRENALQAFIDRQPINITTRTPNAKRNTN